MVIYILAGMTLAVLFFNMEFEYIYDPELEEYYVNVPIDNQTFHIGIQLTDYDQKAPNIAWFNIWLSLYSKRKHMQRNEDLHLSTGRNPLKTYSLGMQAFKELEDFFIKSEKENKDFDEIILYCTWVDNRRREAYYKILKRLGYNWGRTPEGKKCIMRKVKL